MEHWILDENGNVIEASLQDWARWIDSGKRRVGLDRVNNYTISTVMLGIDHNFGLGGPPILFETMVFADETGSQEQEVERYCTLAEARAGHKMMVLRYKPSPIEDPPHLKVGPKRQAKQ